jgi:uncharacterized protein DUF4886
VGRIIRLVAVAAAGVLLAVPLYIGLVKAGVLPNPFAPSVEGDLEFARSDRAGLRVLFVGNSLTYENSIPTLVHELAEKDEGAPPIFAVRYTAPSWTLRRASEDEGLAALLEEVRWDVVVLQEHSAIGSRPGRPPEMYLPARALDAKVDAAGARTMLFMTWSFRDGAPVDVPGENFETMHARLAWGYTYLARDLSAALAPVGLAWAEARRRRPDLDLWASDGRHASLAGSYLAACVFYAMLSGRDPSASHFTAGLNEAEARFLKDVASEVVVPYLRDALVSVR